MVTILHARPYSRFIEIQSSLTRKKPHRTNQNFNFLGCRFSNRDNVKSSIQFRTEKQPSILKYDFFSISDPSVFTSIPVLLGRPNEPSWIFPALKSTSHFLPQSIVSRRSDSSSAANSSSCNRSDAWSHQEQRVVSSAQIERLAGRSLMYSRKSVGSRMESWGTPALTEYSCEDFPYRTTRTCLLLRKDEIRPNIWLKTT